jgi:HEAT repeat protein
MSKSDFLKQNVEEMKKNKDVNGLMKTLNFGSDWDSTWEIRSDAAEALGKMGDARAVEPLIEAVKRNGHIRVRSSAAHALDELGFQPKNDEEKAYYLIAEGRWSDLVNVGEPAVNPLIETLELIQEGSIRSKAAKPLGEIGDARAVQPLTQVLAKARHGLSWEERGGEGLQKEAAKALGKMGDARAVEPLILTLKSEHPDVRLEAALALGKIGDAGAVEPLILALKGGIYGNIRLEIIEALGKIGDARAVELLTPDAKDRDLQLRSAAQRALEKIKARAESAK